MRFLRFIGCFLLNLLFTFWCSVPAWVLLVLHYVIGIRIMWFWIALGAWIGGVLLYMLIIGVISHFGTGEERENENVNPYSYRIGKK